MIRSILNYPRQIAEWLWQGKYHMLSIAGVIATVLYLTRLLTFYPSEVALALSLTGLFLILTLQILDAKEYVDHKPNTVMNWLKSFPRSKNTTVIVGASAAVFTSAKANVSLSIAPDAPLHEKVDFLFRQFRALESTIVNIDDRVDDIRSSLNKTEKNLSHKIDNISSSVNSRIAGHVVGAYDINLFGITITICGTLIQFFLA